MRVCVWEVIGRRNVYVKRAGQSYSNLIRLRYSDGFVFQRNSDVEAKGSGAQTKTKQTSSKIDAVEPHTHTHTHTQ